MKFSLLKFSTALEAVLNSALFCFHQYLKACFTLVTVAKKEASRQLFVDVRKLLPKPSRMQHDSAFGYTRDWWHEMSA